MPTRETDKQLCQRLPLTTSTSILYQNKGEAFVANIKTIFVTNVTGSTATFSLWVNQAASTAADGNAIYKAQSLAANTTLKIETQNFGIVLRGSAATLLCAAGTASAIAFTCYGTEIEET